MANVLIGCPIYKRVWILPTWLRFIEKQDFPLEYIGFIFELGPDDDGTHDILLNWHEKHPQVQCFQGDIRLDLQHTTHPEGCRAWSRTKYLTMVVMRNALLDRATAVADKFDHYFSLDSDILLQNPHTITQLVSYSQTYPECVVSPLSYMTPDSLEFPSVMSWRDGIGLRAYRQDDYPIGMPFLADIVMAAVLMPRKIYTTVRYKAHRQGEDLGFAERLTRSGFQSLAASDIECPHIMYPYMLKEYQEISIEH
jgi:hypothetical protein